jgi:alkylglycerol monooxygenase
MIKCLSSYVFGQYTAIVIVLFFLLLFESETDVFLQVMATLFIIVTVINRGAILEQRRRVFYLEAAQISLVLLTTFFYFPHPATFLIFTALIAGALAYLSTLEKKFLFSMYGR